MNEEWLDDQQISARRLKREMWHKTKEQVDCFLSLENICNDVYHAMGYRNGRLVYSDGGDWKPVTLKQSLQLSIMMERLWITGPDLDKDYDDEDLRLCWLNSIAKML